MHSNNFLKRSWTKDIQFIRLKKRIWLIQFQNHIILSKIKYKENRSFERRPGSGRKPKFDESIKQKNIDLVTDDPYKSIKDIKHELQNNFSKAPSIGDIYSILKDNCFWYVASQLAPKTDDKIRNKRLNWCKRNKSRDWSNIIVMDE